MSEEPDVKKRKTTTHDSTTFKTDASSDGDNTQSIGIDSFDNDIVIRFASYLHSKDIVNLLLTCKTFGGMFNDDGGNTAARQIISFASKDERDALPKLHYQTYIELYSELEQLRSPRLFDQLVGTNLSYVNDDKSYIKLAGKSNDTTAICNHVMRAGKHYVTFQIGGTRDNVQLGLIRPVKDFDKRNYKSFGLLKPGYFGKLNNERTKRWGDSPVYICVLGLKSGNCCYGGRRTFGGFGWNGQESFRIGDDIGMLLDFDTGTLAVYKNERRLGVMRDKLSGDFSWVASVKIPGTTVRIEKGPIPTDLRL